MTAAATAATAASYLRQACVRLMLQSGLLPEGTLQLVIGGTGDLLDRLQEIDVVTFTGSADTAARMTEGAFFAPTLLLCEQPMASETVHDVEAFGPVSTLMPYDDLDETLALAARGRGSLVGTLVTHDPATAAPWKHRCVPSATTSTTCKWTWLTHRRTVSEVGIVAFGGSSGDCFYLHFDEIAAAASPFGKRIAQGYLVLAAAAAPFVSPAPGPVLANDGLDTLRFVKPVGVGDTIQARLTCKRKIDRQKTSPDGVGQGVVAWNVEVNNQLGELVASHDILTLAAKRSAATA